MQRDNSSPAVVVPQDLVAVTFTINFVSNLLLDDTTTNHLYQFLRTQYHYTWCGTNIDGSVNSSGPIIQLTCFRIVCSFVWCIVAKLGFQTPHKFVSHFRLQIFPPSVWFPYNKANASYQWSNSAILFKKRLAFLHHPASNPSNKIQKMLKPHRYPIRGFSGPSIIVVQPQQSYQHPYFSIAW